MKNYLYKILSILLFLFIIINSYNLVSFAAEDTEELQQTVYSTGLLMPSDEEWNEVVNTTPSIDEIEPNSRAVNRYLAAIKSEGDVNLAETIVPCRMGEDFIISKNDPEETYNSEVSLESESSNWQSILASVKKVDNSKIDGTTTPNPYFPPVGDQASLGSCLSWAVAYYQLTNNFNNVRNTSAQDTNGNIIIDNVMSPRWLYSMTNGGIDMGSYFEEVRDTLNSLGCASLSGDRLISDNLYDESDKYEIFGRIESDFNIWPTEKDTYIDAMSNKCKVAYNKNYDITKIKQTLINCYCVSFFSY